ncbi:MAG: fibronectin type III domain-containing protein [Candidatus Zhuqueibacterota bacterium]
MAGYLLIRAMGWFMIFFLFCVSPTDSPPPDKSAPTITVYWPALNDTISSGLTEVSFKAEDDRGIESVELYMNETFVSRNYPQENEAKPAVFLNVDTSFINTRISYYLIAYDLSENSATSETMTSIFVKPNMTPPDAPSNLELTKLSETIINLQWQDNSDNELGFQVWRKNNSNSYASMQTLPANSISANDTGMVSDIVYYYKIRAFNKYSYSESEEANTEGMITRVEAPSNVQAKSFGTNWIRLLWQDNSDNELAFIIERKIASGSVFSQIATLSPNTIQFDDHENLYASTAFTYRIAALSQTGQSDWSNEVTVTTLAIDLVPPSNLVASYDSTNNRVNLTWNDNSIFEVETRIERKIGAAGVFSEIGKVGMSVTAYSDSTVQRNFTYHYRVRAYIQEGLFSDYSNEASVEITP